MKKIIFFSISAILLLISSSDLRAQFGNQEAANNWAAGSLNDQIQDLNSQMRQMEWNHQVQMEQMKNQQMVEQWYREEQQRKMQETGVGSSGSRVMSKRAAENYLANLGLYGMTSSREDIENASKNADFLNKLGSLSQTGPEEEDEATRYKKKLAALLNNPVAQLGVYGAVEYQKQLGKGVAPAEALKWARRTDENTKDIEALVEAGATLDEINSIYDPNSGYLDPIKKGNLIHTKKEQSQDRKLLQVLERAREESVDRIIKLSDPSKAGSIENAADHLKEEIQEVKRLSQMIKEIRASLLPKEDSTGSLPQL